MWTQQKFVILGISVSLEEAVGAWEVWGGSLMLALQVLRVTRVPKCSKGPSARGRARVFQGRGWVLARCATMCLGLPQGARARGETRGDPQAPFVKLQ